MNRGGKIFDLHAANHDGVEAGQRRFNDAIGRVKWNCFGIAAQVNGEIASQCVRNEGKTSAGIDHQVDGLAVIQGCRDDDYAAPLFKRYRRFARRRLHFRFRNSGTLGRLNPVSAFTLFLRDVVQVVGDMEHATLIDPAVVFRGEDRIGGEADC